MKRNATRTEIIAAVNNPANNKLREVYAQCFSTKPPDKVDPVRLFKFWYNFYDTYNGATE